MEVAGKPIKIVKCSCPPDHCDKGVEPPNDCIQRLDGTVETAQCPICNAQTWHHNGVCIRCQRLERDTRQVASRQKQRDIMVPLQPAGLTLTIKCGNEFQVTDKKTVAKILKILLEDR